MRKKILLIEGNRKVLEILAFALGREGYEIIRSDDGLTGIRLAEEQSPDLIVLDLMPSTVSDCDVMSTLDVCRSLRQENIKATILAFTISEEEKDELRDAGADDYIHKPFTMRELLSKVRTNTSVAYGKEIDARMYLWETIFRFLNPKEVYEKFMIDETISKLYQYTLLF